MIFDLGFSGFVPLISGLALKNWMVTSNLVGCCYCWLLFIWNFILFWYFDQQMIETQGNRLFNVWCFYLLLHLYTYVCASSFVNFVALYFVLQFFLTRVWYIVFNPPRTRIIASYTGHDDDDESWESGLCVLLKLRGKEINISCIGRN